MHTPTQPSYSSPLSCAPPVHRFASCLPAGSPLWVRRACSQPKFAPFFTRSWPPMSLAHLPRGSSRCCAPSYRACPTTFMRSGHGRTRDLFFTTPLSVSFPCPFSKCPLFGLPRASLQRGACLPLTYSCHHSPALIPCRTCQKQRRFLTRRRASGCAVADKPLYSLTVHCRRRRRRSHFIPGRVRRGGRHPSPSCRCCSRRHRSSRRL